MKVNSAVQCADFPCLNTRRASYLVPGIDIDPANVSILLISEATPENPADHYYAGENALFARTTLLAFQDAWEKVTCCRIFSIWVCISPWQSSAARPVMESPPQPSKGARTCLNRSSPCSPMSGSIC